MILCAVCAYPHCVGEKTEFAFEWQVLSNIRLRSPLMANRASINTPESVTLTM